MRKIVIIGLAAGFLAAPLPAQATNNNANRSEAAREQSQGNGSVASERQICIREAGSETRIRRTICHTAREWRDLQGVDDSDR
jgi:hypothetical protein